MFLYESLWGFTVLVKNHAHASVESKGLVLMLLMWWCARICILEHISICLTQCLPTGPMKVQQLIDLGALTTWTEDNGLEMCAEFNREVGGETKQKNTFGGSRERFLLVCVCVSLSICLGLMSIRVLAFLPVLMMKCVLT